MTHDELREVVARAMWLARNAPYPYECVSGDELLDLLADADAALAAVWEALREPDAGMMDAWENLKHPAHYENRAATKQASIYRAMLAASPLRPAASKP